MNTFGTKVCLSTFGESHGEAIGGVLDGFPAGVLIDLDFIRAEMARRKPGGKFATPRKENDEIRILSGVFDGVSTGAPIGFIIQNANQHSKDYESIKDLFRPSHADFTYLAKFGVRDYRGGGRASARETAVRVAGGAFCALLLREFGIDVKSGVFSVGKINFGADFYTMRKNLDFDFALNSEIFALNSTLQTKFLDEISRVKSIGDSVGASVITIASGVMTGLGEVLYAKADAKIAEAIMGINGVKAVEIGAGVRASEKYGSENNDLMSLVDENLVLTNAEISNPARNPNADLGDKFNENGRNLGGFNTNSNAKFSKFDRANMTKIRPNFKTNFAGGILGGITNGDEIIITSNFKPTPSIFAPQMTINRNNQECEMNLRGRHDPCIGVRGSVVATAMVRLVLADLLCLNASANLQNLKRVYENHKNSR